MKSTLLAVFLVFGILAGTTVPHSTASAGEQEHGFAVVANLQNPGDEPDPPPFKSVVLRFPWVYALSKDWDLGCGRLYVFKMPQTITKLLPVEDRALSLKPVKVIENVGDGYYMSRWDNLIACAREGGIELFSPHNPGEPTRAGESTPLSGKKYRTRMIVRDENRAYVIGRSVVLTYDLADATRPTCLAEVTTGYDGYAGCMADGYLYVGCEKKQGGVKRPGIVVIDPTEPTKLKELAFVPVSRTVYHLFAIPGGHMIACLDGDILGSPAPGICPTGKSALLDITNPARPSLMKEFKYSGGRSATVFSTASASFLACNAAVFLIREDSLVDMHSALEYRPTLDGFPYRGDSDDTYVALSNDQGAVLLKHYAFPCPNPPAFKNPGNREANPTK